MLKKGKAAGYIAIVAGAALLLYGYTLWLPFFWDDVMHAEWMRNVGLPDIWRGPQAGLGYFRPLTFSIWKTLELARAPNLAFAQHLVNVVLHIANACLVGWLASQMARARKEISAIASAFLFLVFPFVFQVVAPINSLHHLLLVFFVLMSAVIFQMAATTANLNHAKIGAGLGMLCTALAMLSHENAVVSPALLGAIFFALPRRGKTRRAVMLWLLDAATLSVFFGIWLSARAASGSAFSVGDASSRLNDFIANLTYFGQGLAFPITWVAQNLAPKINMPALTLVAFLASVYVLVGLFVCRAVGVFKAALFALAWWLIAALPACVMLAQSYLAQSPRLMYLSSVGVVLFLVAPLGGQSHTRLQKLIGLCASLCVVVSAYLGVAYVQQRATLYKLAGTAIFALDPNAQTATACAAQKNGQTLVINFTEWFFVANSEYALGYDGIKTIAENSGLDELSRTNFGAPKPGETQFIALTLPDLQTKGQPYHSLGAERSLTSLQGDIRASQRVVLGRMTANDIAIREVGCLQTAGAASQKEMAQFGDAVQLVAASAHFAPNNQLVLEITWRAAETPSGDVTVFTHVVDGPGKILAQADGYPVGGAAPMRLWQKGDVWRETRYVDISAAPEAKPQTILIGVYSTQNGRRLPIINKDGPFFGEDAVRISIGP